ncbi:hypothetical protein ACYULU_05745 [Breznakiellaceae bacterium SP9]
MMCTLTIDGIDEALENEISEKAKEFGLSRSGAVKRILEDALLSRKREEKNRELSKFCGIWTDEDAAEFEAATKNFRTVDPRDWE